MKQRLKLHVNAVLRDSAPRPSFYPMTHVASSKNCHLAAAEVSSKAQSTVSGGVSSSRYQPAKYRGENGGGKKNDGVYGSSGSACCERRVGW